MKSSNKSSWATVCQCHVAARSKSTKKYCSNVGIRRPIGGRLSTLYITFSTIISCRRSRITRHQVPKKLCSFFSKFPHKTAPKLHFQSPPNLNSSFLFPLYFKRFSSKIAGSVSIFLWGFCRKIEKF